MYKWETAKNWLLDKITFEQDMESLRTLAWALAHEVNNNTTQNLFAEEMDDDGFYEEKDEDQTGR